MPTATQTVASATAMSGGCGELRVVEDAEPPGPVAGEREDERGEAERPEGRGVEEEPGPEPGDRPEDRPAQERERDERRRARGPAWPLATSSGVTIVTWRSASDADDPEPAFTQSSDGHRPPLAHEHDHLVERVEVDERRALDLLVRVDVALVHARDGADRDAAREERLEAARALDPAVTTVSPTLDLLVLRDAVELMSGVVLDAARARSRRAPCAGRSADAALSWSVRRRTFDAFDVVVDRRSRRDPGR